MREILFRGKRVDNKEWVYGYYFESKKHWHDHGKREAWIAVDAVQNGGWCNVRRKYAVDPDTIGQYTGLTDKNGKKIFEGDIIKSCEYDDIYFVKYCADDNYPAFDVVPEMNIECNGLSHLHIVEGIEVIGNIHDNPELLKGGA